MCGRFHTSGTFTPFRLMLEATDWHTHTHTHTQHTHLPHLEHVLVGCAVSSRASGAVNHLKRFHERKRRGLRPHSLYLDHIIRKSVTVHNRREPHTRAPRDIYAIKVGHTHSINGQN